MTKTRKVHFSAFLTKNGLFWVFVIRFLTTSSSQFILNFIAFRYLTPPNSSGFAPHWDDIDAFIVQTEGRKHWKVYAPKNPREALPLESSGISFF
jgi:hypothetical protein